MPAAFLWATPVSKFQSFNVFGVYWFLCLRRFKLFNFVEGCAVQGFYGCAVSGLNENFASNFCLFEKIVNHIP